MNKDYRLNSIKIEYQSWGEYKGKHIGKISFENGDGEAFMFNLTPEKSDKFLSLISEELVQSASQLGEKLLQCLNLLPDKGTIEIEAKS